MHFFVRMCRFFFILDAFDGLCLVYYNLCINEKSMNDRFRSLFIFYLSRSLNKLSISHQSYPKSAKYLKKKKVYSIHLPELVHNY